MDRNGHTIFLKLFVFKKTCLVFSRMVLQRLPGIPIMFFFYILSCKSITFQQASSSKIMKSIAGVQSKLSGGVASEKLFVLMAFLPQSDRLSSLKPISQSAPHDLE